MESIPADQALMVWPSRDRSVRVSPKGGDLEALVQHYFQGRGGPFSLFPGSFPDPIIANVTVEEVGPGNCLASLELDRDTWITSARVEVPNAGLTSNPQVERCLYAALDFINGFPVKANAFRFDQDLPSEDVRSAVMWALLDCSRQASPNSTERTRDGVAPFPSRDCALKELSQ